MQRNNKKTLKDRAYFAQNGRMVIHGDSSVANFVTDQIAATKSQAHLVSAAHTTGCVYEMYLKNKVLCILKVYHRACYPHYDVREASCITIICIDTTEADYMTRLYQYHQDISNHRNGRILVLYTGKNNTENVEKFCFEKGVDSSSHTNDFPSYKKLHHFLIRSINALYAVDDEKNVFFKHKCSFSFCFNQVTSYLLLNAIYSAKKCYFQLHRSPDFFLSYKLENRLTAAGLNQDELNHTNKIKVNEYCCRLLLNLLQGTGGTKRKSFKYLLLSELFNVFTINDTEASEIISTVVTLLKSCYQLNNDKLKKFYLFTTWAKQNGIPKEVVEYVANISHKLGR